MKIKVAFQEESPIKVDFCQNQGTFVAQFDPVQMVTIGGSYDQLINRPSINEHELVGGENSLQDLGIGRATTSDILRLFS